MIISQTLPECKIYPKFLLLVFLAELIPYIQYWVEKSTWCTSSEFRAVEAAEKLWRQKFPFFHEVTHMSEVGECELMTDSCWKSFLKESRFQSYAVILIFSSWLWEHCDPVFPCSLSAGAEDRKVTSFALPHSVYMFSHTILKLFLFSSHFLHLFL